MAQRETFEIELDTERNEWNLVDIFCMCGFIDKVGVRAHRPALSLMTSRIRDGPEAGAGNPSF